jgi:multidrug efflux pump
MYLFGYSIDNISLMALTICTGFVVDDAIVVIENITRHFEQGMNPLEAALHGAQEIGFTVLSMTLSLVAVFIPILHDGRHRGPPVPRVCHHAFGVDPGFSAGFLTMTPMMCARLLKREHGEAHGRLYRINEKAFSAVAGLRSRPSVGVAA